MREERVGIDNIESLPINRVYVSLIITTGEGKSLDTQDKLGCLVLLCPLLVESLL